MRFYLGGLMLDYKNMKGNQKRIVIPSEFQIEKRRKYACKGDEHRYNQEDNSAGDKGNGSGQGNFEGRFQEYIVGDFVKKRIDKCSVVCGFIQNPAHQYNNRYKLY